MLEMHQRGYSVYYADPYQLSLSPRGIGVRARRVHVLTESPFFVFDQEETLPIERFQVVWIRKDPPVDDAYLYMTQILSLADRRTRILNSPQALRDWNEKLIILNFPRWIPPTLVSSSPAELARFAERHGVIVLKPLAGFAGQGVVKIDSRNPAVRTLIEQATHNGQLPVMAQAFLKNIRRGEKRVFLLDGQVWGALLKVPSKGGFLANPDHGASLSKTTLTMKEHEISRSVATFLKKHDIFFAGLDMIDGRMTEINITSPGLLWEWNRIENKPHEKFLVDRLERRFLRR